VSASRHIRGFDETFTTSEDRDLCDRWLQSGYRLVFVPNAVVYHAKELTPRSFLRQHYAYGRGAIRYHRARSPRSSRNLKLGLGFYFAVLRALLRHHSRFSLAALLVLWQAAHAVGFMREWFDYPCQLKIRPGNK
jgi:GT2 family glycosyltransferase